MFKLPVEDGFSRPPILCQMKPMRRTTGRWTARRPPGTPPRRNADKRHRPLCQHRANAVGGRGRPRLVGPPLDAADESSPARWKRHDPCRTLGLEHENCWSSDHQSRCRCRIHAFGSKVSAAPQDAGGHWDSGQGHNEELAAIHANDEDNRAPGSARAESRAAGGQIRQRDGKLEGVTRHVAETTVLSRPGSLEFKPHHCLEHDASCSVASTTPPPCTLSGTSRRGTPAAESTLRSTQNNPWKSMPFFSERLGGAPSRSDSTLRLRNRRGQIHTHDDSTSCSQREAVNTGCLLETCGIASVEMRGPARAGQRIPGVWPSTEKKPVPPRRGRRRSSVYRKPRLHVSARLRCCSFWVIGETHGGKARLRQRRARRGVQIPGGFEQAFSDEVGA